MRIRIPKSQVHEFNGNLQFDLQFPDYPDLPTYGMQILLPVTKGVIQAAIEAKVIEVLQQIEKDTIIRDRFVDLLDTDLEIAV